jgi:hypothetical protein
MQGVKDGGRPVSALFTTVKSVQLELMWRVTKHSSVDCNETECKQNFQNNGYFCGVTDRKMRHHENFIAL